MKGEFAAEKAKLEVDHARDVRAQRAAQSSEIKGSRVNLAYEMEALRSVHLEEIQRLNAD